ncbi:MAG: hypothetical protein B1H08_00885 [Candidatus Omnitrophica bacterium 4484_171]|nr:MAG: hypothetical protein B1H08_00885 [Candidatus Omnitrophica bacterium 4484_171]
MITKYAFDRKKSIVLVIVMGIVVIITFLCLATAYLLSQQARVAEHKIRRMRAYYAAMAGVVYAFDKARNGILPAGNSSIKVGNGIYGYPPGGFTVDISRTSNAGPGNTDEIDVSVDYTL